jgi:predicted nucleic acid-binding protein
MAAKYLLDTSVFSDLMRDHRKVTSRFTVLSPSGRVLVNPVVRGEILYGLGLMAKGRKREHLAARAQSLFARLACEAIPESAADHYARLKREAETKGLRLDENDLWIASTAVALDAVLITRDRDFRRVAGLLVEDWSR